jgi:uracil-DNA glycosylase
MIPKFLLEKYGPEVCQIMIVDGRVKGENIRNYKDATERQPMVAAQMHKIVLELGLNFQVENNNWAFDFPGWLGQLDEEHHKKYMIIGMEPHIADFDFQVTYGLSENYNSQMVNNRGFKIDETTGKPLIWNYDSGLIWSNLFELFASDYEKKGVYQERNVDVLIHFLEQFYITDMCHFAPRGKAKEIRKVPKWEKVRYRIATRFLEQEIVWVQPEIIITQGNIIFGDLKTILGFEELDKIPLDFQGWSIRQGILNLPNQQKITIISLPHFGSKLNNKVFWGNNMENVKRLLQKNISG